MVQLAFFMLIIWCPVVALFFQILPPQRAAVAGLVSAWLLLPPTGISLPGFPDYTKMTAATIGVFIGTFLFRLNYVMKLRLRWYDLPIIVMCVCPIVSSATNGLGLYDGCSAAFGYLIMWLLPYFVGRIYLSSSEGLRELCTGIVVGGLAYIPPCLWEIRLSPQLQFQIYGVFIGVTEVRFGGYRPRVFLSTGLELGMWMSAASLTAWWLWKAGVFKKMFDLPFGKLLLPAIFVTTLMCKSTGALFLLSMSMATLWASVRFKTRAFLLTIVLAAPAYYLTRTTGLWDGNNLVDLSKMWVGEDRAQSLEFRFINENLLIDKALDQPYFGWGGWGRNLTIDPPKLRAVGFKRVIPDGLWIIVFGSMGWVGLLSMTATILLPIVLFMVRFPPKDWMHPRVAPATVIAMLLSIYMVDCLLNGMVNLIYTTAAGGLMAFLPSRHLIAEGSGPDSRPAEMVRPSRETVRGIHQRANGAEFDHPVEQFALALEAPEQPISDSPQAKLAERYTTLARSLTAKGKRAEAEGAWSHASILWAKLTTTHPEVSRYLSSWCDICNDLAWFLLEEPDPAARDVPRALDLAIKATEVSPDRDDYWNTLGVAFFRAGDDQAALDALHRSLDLKEESGNGFDYLYLAMACSRLAQHDIARLWYEQGLEWIEEHAPDNQQLNRLVVEARNEFKPRERSESIT